MNRYHTIIVVISFSMNFFLTQGCDMEKSDNATYVYSSYQLISILNLLSYDSLPMLSGHLPITEDIQIIGKITINSNQLKPAKLHEHCECPVFDCYPELCCVNNFNDERIELSYSPIEYEYMCPPFTLTLEDVKLRFRHVYYDNHPDGFPCIPTFIIMPPSDYECEAIQFRCDIDEVCYDSYLSYCYSCLAMDEEKCACRDNDGLFDGVWCDFPIGTDTFSFGECENGVCTATY